MKAELLSPATLAFVGDSVYSLLVRESLAAINRPAKALHVLSVRLVNAVSQAEAYGVVEPFLTDKERELFRRGRNAHLSHVPKSASVADYHTATGLEALFGFWQLAEQPERMKEIFSHIWAHFSETMNLEVGSVEEKAYHAAL